MTRTPKPLTHFSESHIRSLLNFHPAHRFVMDLAEGHTAWDVSGGSKIKVHGPRRITYVLAEDGSVSMDLDDIPEED